MGLTALELSQSPVAVVGLALATFLLSKQVFKIFHGGPSYHSPPGPKGYPIIGNLFEIGRRIRPWVTYSNLSKEYGDMVYLESLGTRVLVLHSVERATDLLDRRSSKYSGRPYLPMLCGEMEYDRYFSNMDYGPMWRRQRRALHQELNPSVVSRYQPILTGEIPQYIQDLTKSPQRFKRHVRHYFDRIIFKAFYGVKIKEENDPYVRSGEVTMEGFILAAVPGTFLVDIFPALKNIPKWMPGAAWKRVGEFYRGISERARKGPYEHALKVISEGACENCVATRLIEKLPDTADPAREEEEVVARDALAVGYIAGADTSTSAAMTFILLMALHPQVQKRAQAELDEIIGFGQLPTHQDRPKLIYIQALIMEVFRWHGEVPLGVAHRTTEDDIYEGYFIPKGTIVTANAWHMLHSPDNYENPSDFNPERFIKNGAINKDILDPYTVIFGFGRRICPGRHLSLDTLFSLFTATLATFDISPPKDEAGNPTATMEYSFNSGGAIISPEPYECSITPRSDPRLVL